MEAVQKLQKQLSIKGLFLKPRVNTKEKVLTNGAQSNEAIVQRLEQTPAFSQREKQRAKTKVPKATHGNVFQGYLKLRDLAFKVR